MPPPGAPEYDFAVDLKRRLQPHLEEVGVEAFVMIGYARGADGRTKRLVVVNAGQDVAHEDGLRSAILFAAAWGSSGTPRTPPTPNEKSDTPG